MTPTTMRQLWTMIESTQVSTLLQQDDVALVQWLLKQLTAQQALDEPEIRSLNSYINSRLHLIRDTAFSRKSNEFGNFEFGITPYLKAGACNKDATHC